MAELKVLAKGVDTMHVSAVVETYAHVTAKMRSSAVSKVRDFFEADAGAANAEVARPRVETGGNVVCDPPVTPPRPTESKQALGEG